MQARDAGVQQAAAHLRPQVDSVGLHGFLVLGYGLQRVQNRLWDLRLAEARHALEAAVALDGHEPREDGHLDARLPAVPHELQEDVAVVEELRDDEPGPRVHLLLQVRDVLPVVLLHLLGVVHDEIGMRLGVPRHADAEVVPVSLPDEAHEVQGALEAALYRLELLLALRRVAAQGQDVPDARGLAFLQGLRDHLRLHVRAGQVHHRLHASLVLHPVGDVERNIGRGAPRAPGDVAEDRAGSHHPVHPPEQVLNSLGGARAGRPGVSGAEARQR